LIWGPAAVEEECDDPPAPDAFDQAPPLPRAAG
jgi:hypothetical protein